MAQHSGGIRRPRKSYLISLLPISHFHSPFSFIHTSILSFSFFFFFGPLTFLLFPSSSTSSPSSFVSPFFSILFLSSFSDSTHSYTLRLSSFYPRFCSRIRNTFSLLSSHSHTDPCTIRAAKHALSCSLFFAPFQHFSFFSSSTRFCLFVGVNGFTYLQAFFSWSCIHLPLEATYLPPITYISFFSFFSLSLFSFFLFFLFHLNIGKLDIVSQSLSIFFVLFASNLVVESNILKLVCVSRNTSRLRVSLYVYLLLVCLTASVSVYACVCLCV